MSVQTEAALKNITHVFNSGPDVKMTLICFEKNLFPVIRKKSDIDHTWRQSCRILPALWT